MKYSSRGDEAVFRSEWVFGGVAGKFFAASIKAAAIVGLTPRARDVVKQFVLNAATLPPGVG